MGNVRTRMQIRHPGGRALECGDSSPLSRRRLVAAEVPSVSEPARTLALARAVSVSLLTDASFNPTATSRLGNAVTSHRTPNARP